MCPVFYPFLPGVVPSFFLRTLGVHIHHADEYQNHTPLEVVNRQHFQNDGSSFFNDLQNIGKYHIFRQLRLVLWVKLMEINSNLFSRDDFLPLQMKKMVVNSP